MVVGWSVVGRARRSRLPSLNHGSPGRDFVSESRASATGAIPVGTCKVPYPSEVVGGWMAGLKEKTPFFPCCSAYVPQSQSTFASDPSSSISSVGSYVVAGDWYRLV